MDYQSAIAAHRARRYQQHVAQFSDQPELILPEAEYCAGGQFEIAPTVAAICAEKLGGLVTFDVFDNGREHGVTVSGPGGWTFCAYEHRNSDQVCVEGCPTNQMHSFGPYGGHDSWDVLATTSPADHPLGAAAAQIIIDLIEYLIDHPGATRAELKNTIGETGRSR